MISAQSCWNDDGVIVALSWWHDLGMVGAMILDDVLAWSRPLLLKDMFTDSLVVGARSLRFPTSINGLLCFSNFLLWLAMCMLACLLDGPHVWGMFLLDTFGLEYCKHAAIVVHFPSCLLPVFGVPFCIDVVVAGRLKLWWCYVLPLAQAKPFATPRGSWWLWSKSRHHVRVPWHCIVYVSHACFAWKNCPLVKGNGHIRQSEDEVGSMSHAWLELWV